MTSAVLWPFLLWNHQFILLKFCLHYFIGSKREVRCIKLLQFLITLGQKKLLICFSGTAASAKLSPHQTFLSLFFRNFHILSLLVFSIIESMFSVVENVYIWHIYPVTNLGGRLELNTSICKYKYSLCGR